MQSTRSFFNRAVFAKTVKRYWPLWALYMLVWALALGVCAQDCGGRYWADFSFDHHSLLQFAWQFGLFSSAIVSCISAMLVHSWMYNSRSASAYSCLPICRGSLFTSITFAGIVPILVCNLIACIVALIVALFSGHFIILTVLQCFAVMSLECLFFYGLATLCAALTGHVFVLPVVYGIFNFVVVVVELLVRSLMSYFTFGAGGTVVRLQFLSPFVFLFDEIRVSTNEATGLAVLNNWWAFIIYAIVGIILAVCAMLIFRKRRMESASDVVAVNVLKPVFKYCLCFGCALVLGLLLFTILFEVFFETGAPAASIVICICMLLGGFIGYFAAEMLMKKSFKVFRKTWRGFIVSCAVIVLFITAIETDVFGYERYIPDADDISAATIRIWGEPTSFTDTEDIAQVMLLHQRIINNKSQTEKNLYEYHKNAPYSTERTSYPISVTISYTMGDYTSVERYYDIMYSEVDKFSSDLLGFINRPEAIVSRIENAIDAEYINDGRIYYYYNVPAGTYIEDYEKEYEMEYASDRPASYAVAESRPVYAGSVPYVTVDVSDRGEMEYVHGNVQLTAAQARELLENAILRDAREGNIGRVLPSNNGYKGKISVNIELTSRIPYYTPDNMFVDYYDHQYIYMHDITEKAVHTVAAFKELGIDLEALSVDAIDRNNG